MIHLGNYEEFFVLYMDNELSNDEMRQVDAFLIEHPDLQAEFEILAGTKLPAETFVINKEDLLADSMKLNTIDEELLLYIDDELSADKKKIVELELSSNSNYQLQHQLLLNAKLDAGETIIYPDKRELYHRTERRIVGMKVWMSAAAAVMVVAFMGLLYYNGTSIDNPQDPSTIAIQKNNAPKKSSVTQPLNNTRDEMPPLNIAEKDNGSLMAKNPEPKKNSGLKETERTEIINEPLQNVVASNETVVVHREQQKQINPIDIMQPGLTMGHLDISGDNSVLNNLPVTSSDTETYNNTNATTENNVIAGNNETKGSVKGFLRKATRLIEKRTGIDATSDGELLIGVVAVKLK